MVGAVTDETSDRETAASCQREVGSGIGRSPGIV